MNKSLTNLAGCADVASLRSALRSICSRFGSVARLDILASTSCGKRHAVCLVRMESLIQERLMMARLGGERSGGGGVRVVVDLGA